MLTSAKSLSVLALVSGLAAALLYWWWGRLIVADFSQCVGGNPAAGVDCTHNLQIIGAIGFAALAAVLLIFAIARSVRSRTTSVA